MTFATAWMDLEDVLLSEEVRQQKTKTDTAGYHSYVQSKKAKIKKQSEMVVTRS